MGDLKIMGLDGKSKKVDGSAVETLASAVRGGLLQAGDDGYDEARTVWNAMIEKKPALIARCLGAADVIAAIDFAREQSILTAIRSGGHNIAGNSVCDQGLMIDLSQMRLVRIDAINQVAYVGPGATLCDLDHESLAHGLATPVGVNSTTGVAGLALGGGFGWLSRKYGMTCDNLIGADVVTVDGKYLHVSETEHPDLFWAIRGGGGNFGIITQFEFRLHKVGPGVLTGMIVYPLSEAVEALKLYREYVKTLKNESTVWALTRKAPPLPFLPEEVHGTEILVFAFCHTGDPEVGKKAFEPLRKFGTVLGEFMAVQPLEAWQAIFDPLLTPGSRNYWKSHNFAELSDEIIEVGVKYANNLPSPQCEIFFAHLGGEINRLDSSANAYAHREANYVLNVHGRWDDASDDAKCVKWSRDLFEATKPYASAGVYINFMTAEEVDRVEFAFGSNYEKLMKVKQKYDPNNILRLNQNIQPGKEK